MTGETPALDIDRLLTTLDRHEVDFLLVGGVAAIAHGALRPTADLDCLARRSRENLGRLASAMRELHARLRVEGVADEDAAQLPVRLDADTLGRMEISTWRTDAGDFDILTDFPPVMGDDCARSSFLLRHPVVVPTTTRTPPKRKARQLAKHLRGENPDYAYLKAVFRHLRTELEVGVQREPKWLLYVPTEAEIAATTRRCGRAGAARTSSSSRPCSSPGCGSPSWCASDLPRSTSTSAGSGSPGIPSSGVKLMSTRWGLLHAGCVDAAASAARRKARTR